MSQNFDLSRFQKVKAAMQDLQRTIIASLEQISSDRFQQDVWDYQGASGGGVSAVVTGQGFEKGGVNFSAIEGQMNEKIAAKMGMPPQQKFLATGVSLVLHPHNPFVPTVHANVRFFDVGDRFWFGGGVDLTPYYPFLEDVCHFHQELKNTCDHYDESYYPRFKKWCDEYFYLEHRKETRGVGGIFYDYLNHDFSSLLSFTMDVGHSFVRAYNPIYSKRNCLPYQTEEKNFQKLRRGRYVEFNLIYDRGTLFGLETGGRVESILMSLPPQVSWQYNWQPSQSEAGRTLNEFLKPRDWLSENAD